MSFQSPRKHILLVTFPAYGHIIPILELGRKISKFHDVTLAVSAEIVDQMIEREVISPEENVQFYRIPDGFSKNTILDPTSMSSFEDLMKPVLPGIVELIASLPANNSVLVEQTQLKFVDAVIVEEFVSNAVVGCHEKGIPFYHFLASSAGSMIMFLMIDENWPELPEGAEMLMMEAPQPGQSLPPIPVLFKKMFLEINITLPMVSGVIVNSVAELEEEVMGTINHHPKLNGIKLRTVGPLMPTEKENPKNLAQLERISEWMNQKRPASVVYVSFGSAAFLNADQIAELAKGLLALKKPFIWSIRSSYHEHLPDEIRARIPDQFSNLNSPFLIVDWAPQKFILGHASTAVFISHCGWNSTLESISSGVPIVAWPMFADQKINSGFLASKGMAIHLEGTGMKPKRIIPAEEITETVAKVAGWNGEPSSYWTTTQEWKTKIEQAQAPGGSSYENFMDLMKFSD